MKKVLLITALVFGLGVAGFAAPFSGSWEMDITFAPQSPITYLPTTGFRTILTIDYTISDWTFSSVSELGGGTGWHRQDFLAEGAIGAFTLTNVLRFDPAETEFNFLRSTAAAVIAGVDLTGRVLIVGPTTVEDELVPAGSGFAAGFSAPVEDLTFAATAYFGSLAFDPPADHPDYPWVVYLPTHTPIFRGLDVDLTMPFYCTTLTIDADFVTGFEDITFTIPRFPLGIPGFELDLKVEYTLARKAVTITPHITVRDWLHFQPFISVVGLIDGLRLDGLRLVWDVTEAVRFRYFWDADAHVDHPHILPGGADFRHYRQMVELRYSEEPITLTMAGRWRKVGVPPAMPMFPNWVDINLAVDVLPGFTIRTGLYFQDTALAFMTFGFALTW